MALDPLTAGALVSAGAGIIGNIFGKSNTDKTNQMNLKINQMNNDFNREMMEKQMQYNTEMWNKQNEYNTPSEQVKRLKEAGINPVMAMQGQGGGTAASALGVNAATAASSAQMQTFSPDMQPFSQLADQLFRKELMNEDIKGKKLDNDRQQIENETLHQRLMAQLDESYQRAQDSRTKRRLDSARWLLESRQMNQDYYNSIQSERQMMLQNEGIRLDNIYKNLQNINADPMFKAEIAQRWANVGLMNANKTLTFKQVKHEAEKIVETTARASGIKLDNSLKKRIEDSLVQEAKNRAFFSQYSDNWLQLGAQAHDGFNNFVEHYKNEFKNSYIYKKSARLWKDTRRSFGLYW